MADREIKTRVQVLGSAHSANLSGTTGLVATGAGGHATAGGVDTKGFRAVFASYRIGDVTYTDANKLNLTVKVADSLTGTYTNAPADTIVTSSEDVAAGIGGVLDEDQGAVKHYTIGYNGSKPYVQFGVKGVGSAPANSVTIFVIGGLPEHFPTSDGLS